MDWKKKRRGCMDVIEGISESVEMNKKDFIKKVGIETDEENKVVCPL
jgi:Leucine zipper with capping helix domain